MYGGKDVQSRAGGAGEGEGGGLAMGIGQGVPRRAVSAESLEDLGVWKGGGWLIGLNASFHCETRVSVQGLCLLLGSREPPSWGGAPRLPARQQAHWC